MKYSLFMLLLLLVSCQEQELELPVSEEELLPILIDVHIAEAALQNLRGDTKDSTANLYYEQICTIHGVDRVLLDSSLSLLRTRPIILERLYVKAMEEADKMLVKNKSEEIE